MYSISCEHYRKSDVRKFLWLLSNVDFVEKVGLELDLEESRIWIKSHKREESLSRGRVMRL